MKTANEAVNTFSITKDDLGYSGYVVIAPEGDFDDTHSVTVRYPDNGEATISHWSGNGSPAEVAMYAAVINMAVAFVADNPTKGDWSYSSSPAIVVAK
jgi:hypothetical protein